MKRGTFLSRAPIVAAAFMYALPASAEEPADATAGPTTSEVRSTDTVAVHRSIRPKRPWLITGGAILAGTYVTTAAITSSSGREVEDRNLLIPVVGPWLNLSDRRCDGCEDETRNVALVIGSGVARGIGPGMALASFFMPEKVAAATIQAGPIKLHVMPTTAGRGGTASGYLRTAREELAAGRKLVIAGEEDDATTMLLRAEADAELAMKITREPAALADAKKTRDDIRTLRTSMKGE